MRTILVTGGAGYIGSHTCKALAAAGYRPIVLDNLVYGHRWAVKWGALVEGDVRDAAILDHVFSQYRPEAVLHFAAYAYVGESVGAPGKYYANNVAASVALLEAMRRHGCANLVFSSTCAIFGEPEQALIDERTPTRPVNPYGRSKLMVEQIMQDFGRAYGLRHVSLRYFNAAGADPEQEVGEAHEPETHLIPLVLEVAQGRRAHIDIYGTDYPTPDGTAVRDYVHVADLASAHVQALEYLRGGGVSSAFNLGLGRGYSVQEIVDAARRVTGCTITTRGAPRRAGDPPHLVADPGAAARALDWRPHYGQLDDIVATAWAWHQRITADEGQAGRGSA
ncbi:UDP-glucose 4-epimerase GalE [Ectothiorhodospiraceae bacterium 2226]|nr:UDP-glucose 4-epimerase GalE [Ectothiorhodospiraceae bacterium 2226]